MRGTERNSKEGQGNGLHFNWNGKSLASIDSKNNVTGFASEKPQLTPV